VGANKGTLIMAKKRFKKDRYLKSGGAICPFCKTYNITAGQSDFDSDYMAQKVSCEECESEWTDFYRLVNAEEVTNNT